MDRFGGSDQVVLPSLVLQHMLWHEGYHHGQIKLALKAVGHPITDEVAGPVTWGIWMRKT